MIHQNNIKNDFGLRSIKAVIALAEQLKLLSYGV